MKTNNLWPMSHSHCFACNIYEKIVQKRHFLEIDGEDLNLHATIIYKITFNKKNMLSKVLVV